MDYFEINGSKKLNGVVEVSGAKNAVLPLMAAAILNKDKLKKVIDSTLFDKLRKEEQDKGFTESVLSRDG